MTGYVFLQWIVPAAVLVLVVAIVIDFLRSGE